MFPGYKTPAASVMKRRAFLPPYGDKDATTKIKPTFQVFILIFRPLAGVKVQQQNETKNKKRTNRTCHCFTVLILKYNITEAKKKQKRMNWAK